MPTKKKVADDVIAESYCRLKSVWLVGEEVGLCGQTVWERLHRLGLMKNNHFTLEERQRLRREYIIYRDAGKLAELAASIGRPKTTICSMAGRMGLTDRTAPKKYLRFWKGMPESVARGIFDKFKRSSLGLGQFCKRYGYGEVGFWRTIKSYFPDEWEAVIESKAPKQTMYRLGRQLEYRVRDLLREAGYIVLRSPQSKGPADLVALKSGAQLFVQCKRSGSLPPAEWNHLFDLAESVGAVPLVASRPTGRGIVFKRLNGHKIPHKRQPPWEDWAIA
jgi:Holliday junction resolvase